MIKSLFLPNPRLSWCCRTQTSSDIDIPKKGHLCEPPSGVGGLLRHPRVASCPFKLPFADADLQSTTWFALCLLICTNLTPQFFGEPFSSSHSSVQQFFIKSTWTPALKHVTRNSYGMPLHLLKNLFAYLLMSRTKIRNAWKHANVAELSRNIAPFPFAAPRPWATFPLDSFCHFRYAATMPSPGMPLPHSFTKSQNCPALVWCHVI